MKKKNDYIDDDDDDNEEEDYEGNDNRRQEDGKEEKLDIQFFCSSQLFSVCSPLYCTAAFRCIFPYTYISAERKGGISTNSVFLIASLNYFGSTMEFWFF